MDKRKAIPSNHKKPLMREKPTKHLSEENLNFLPVTIESEKNTKRNGFEITQVSVNVSVQITKQRKIEYGATANVYDNKPSVAQKTLYIFCLKNVLSEVQTLTRGVPLDDMIEGIIDEEDEY